MSSSNLHSSTLLLLLLLIHSTSAIPPSDLDAALSALRSNHHNLFANAITTSPLYLHLLLSAPSVTLFAPSDHSLSSLPFKGVHLSNQLASTLINQAVDNNFLSTLHSSPSSCSILHRHATVGALSSYDLHLLLHPKGSFPLPTLDDTCADVIVSEVGGFIVVNGVSVSQPDLYFSPSIAVHGLNGILDVGTDTESSVLFTRPAVPLPKLVLLGGDRLRHQHPGGKIRPLKGSDGEDGGGYSAM